MEIIAKELVRGKMVIGHGGHGGGYVLCREPEKYVVGEILEWMEGSLDAVSCLAEDTPPCARTGTCKTLPLWKEYNQIVHDFFMVNVYPICYKIICAAYQFVCAKEYDTK